MMRSTARLILAVLAWLLCWTAAAQGQQAEALPEPDEVLDAFYEALGGEMALSGMSEVRAKGSYSGSSSGTIELNWIRMTVDPATQD